MHIAAAGNQISSLYLQGTWPNRLPARLATGDTGRARDVCFIFKLHLNELETSNILVLLLKNVCYMVMS